MLNKIKKLLSLLLISSIGGLLAAFGGAENTTKGWRRLGIPLLITLIALCTLRNPWCISIMFMSFVLAIGYGMPDTQDTGSSLGQFWYRLTSKIGQNESKQYLFATLLTRGSVSVLIALSMIVVPIIKANWLIYALCSLGIVVSYATLSWRDLGTFKFKNKQLLYSEFIPFSIIVILAQILIMY